MKSLVLIPLRGSYSFVECDFSPLSGAHSSLLSLNSRSRNGFGTCETWFIVVTILSLTEPLQFRSKTRLCDRWPERDDILLVRKNYPWLCYLPRKNKHSNNNKKTNQRTIPCIEWYTFLWCLKRKEKIEELAAILQITTFSGD
jgi:hypothetical protein